MLNLYEIEHFIQPGTLVNLGWSEELHDGRPALRFTTASGPRWRYGDGEKPKYDQNVGYTACWYGLRRAAANARLWGLDAIVDCNGAASTIAADQYHVPAFSLQSGEGTRPRPELIAELKALWSGSVIVAFDCDAPGRAGAIKRVQAYRDVGIEAEAVDLGLDLDGGDLADFVGAGKLLSACNRLPIPQAVKVAPKQYDRASFAGWTAALDEIKQRLSCYDFMLQRYGEPKKRGQKHGHWLAVQRPEDTASFCAYMGAGGWYDYGPGEGGDIFDLIELVESCSFTEALRLAAGIANIALPERSEPLTAPIIISNENGKPDHLLSGERGALYRNTDRVTAILIDAAANAGPTFDIPYLVCCAEFHGISASSVYKAVNRLSVVFLHCGAYIEDSNRDKSIDSDRSSICATVEECLSDLEERRVGRPATMYKLADRATLHAWILKQAIPKIVKETFTKKLGIAAPVQVAFLEELGLDEFEAAAKAKELERLHGRALSEQPGARQAMQDVRKRVRTLKAQLASSPDAPIPAGVLLDNRPNMLAAALRALIGVLGKAFQLTQEKLCGLIGCRKNELASVCRAVGLVVDHRVYEDRPAVNEPAVLRVPRKYDPEVGGFPDRVISSYDKRGMGFSSPTLERWVHKQFMQVKAQVFIRYRLANWYRLAEPEPVTEPIEIPETPKALAVQPELIPVERAAPFLPFWRALVMFRFAARLLNALVMAWSVAKEAAWHLRQHTAKAVPYAVNWLRKVVDAVTPWQPVGADLVDATTGEKQAFSVQLSFNLLLDSEATWKPSTLTSTPFDNGAGSCAPPLTPESTAPGNTSYTSLSPTSGPTCTTAPPLSRPTENITTNANVLALEGT